MSNVKVKATKKPVKPVIVVVYILLVILAVIYLAPLLWMLSVSLKDNAGVMSAPFSLPEVFHFENYAQAWQMGKLGTALINSVIVCGATLIVSLFFGAMAAFAIARMRWKLSEFMEMFEAAAIDGCGIYGCFFRIALPLCRTGFFVSGLMTFINNWNELLLAMVFISDPMKKTLPVTLTYFVGPYATNYVQMFAAIIIAIAPTVVVYSLFSNQIVEGLTTGAVKG